MSKAITITLPNAIADTLERHVAAINTSLPPGVCRSKSNYVASSVKVALEKDGCIVVTNEGNPIKPKPEVIIPAKPKPSLPPL